MSGRGQEDRRQSINKFSTNTELDEKMSVDGTLHILSSSSSLDTGSGTDSQARTTLSRESSSSSEGKRRRPGRIRDRFRLSVSDTSVSLPTAKNVKSEGRKRKSMSDYLGM